MLQNKEMRKIIGASDYPFPHLRADYTWIERNYLPFKKLQAERHKLAQELREVKAALPDAGTLRERVETSHKAYEQRLTEAWAKLLMKGAKSTDPLSRIEKKITDARLNFVPWDVLDKALCMIEQYGIDGVSDKDRSKSISAIEKKIAAVDAQLVEVMPETFYSNNGNRICGPEPFVDHWRSLQGATADPVAPDAKSLTLSTPEEKAAHQALQLGLVINEKARQRAWRPE